MSINQPETFIEIDEDEQMFWNNELNALRESGTMNMFGAVQWLSDNWENMSKNEAKQIFYNWTRTFEEQKDMNETLIEVLRILAIIACFAAPAYIMFKYPDEPEW